MCGNGVGQTAWFVNAGNGREDFGRNFFVQFDVLIKLLHDRAAQRLNFAALCGFFGGQLNGHHARYKVSLTVGDGFNLGALLTLHQHLHGAIGQLEHLQDGGDATHLKHVGHFRLIFGGRLLGDQHDAAVGEHGAFKRFDALGAAHKQGDDHVRKDHHVAQWQHGQINEFGGQWCVSRHEVP